MRRNTKETMNVTKIYVLTRRYGPDVVMMDTELPSPFPFDIHEGLKLDVMFKTPKGEGMAYCRKHFGNIEMEEINECMDDDMVTIDKSAISRL